ncbi:MAG TPA: hypothetical protein VG347_17710 [Verrucomicrobiae bacterium]|nr:hypothetical protein [Verrucomicrobiae bacterium]
MNELSKADLAKISAAYGWIDLKCYPEAIIELNSIPDHLYLHPKVVAAWWEINCSQAEWVDLLKYGTKLLQEDASDPMGYILLAESARLRNNDHVKDAYEILRPIADRFSDALTVPYNLACYACCLGRVAEAREWLQTTFKGARGTEFDGYYQGLAIEDADLKSLWPEIHQISLKSKHF